MGKLPDTRLPVEPRFYLLRLSSANTIYPDCSGNTRGRTDGRLPDRPRPLSFFRNLLLNKLPLYFLPNFHLLITTPKNPIYPQKNWIYRYSLFNKRKTIGENKRRGTLLTVKDEMGNHTLSACRPCNTSPIFCFHLENKNDILDLMNYIAQGFHW